MTHLTLIFQFYIKSIFFSLNDVMEEESCCGHIVVPRSLLWPQDWKRSVFISIPKKGNAKECSKLPHNYIHFTCQQSMLKILQARLQYQVNQKPPNVQAGFRKGRGTRDKLPTSVESQRKQENFRRTSTSASKPLTVWILTDCGKFFKRGEYQTTLPPEKSVCRSRSNSQNWTWKNGRVPNLERSTSRLYIVSLLI